MRTLLYFVTFAFAAALPATGQTTDELRADLFRRLNDLRAKDKIAPLVRNTKLDAAAQKHAENLAKQDKFGDDGKNGHVLDGKTFIDRTNAEGYKSAKTGENAAFTAPKKTGDKAVETAVGNWVNSPGHYANIMEKGFNEVGVGLAQSTTGKWYFITVFGKKGK